MKIRSLARWSFVLITLFWVGIFASSSFSAREKSPTINKISPWVLEKTANGGEAEFLVALADQADISGADALATKAEKGRHVRDVLWNKAQETQKPILEWLAARKIEHRSYYITNVIWVKANEEVALALASRPDVARLEGNPLVRNYPADLAITEEPSEPNVPTAVEPGVTYIKAPQVWATGFTGQGIVIGGADTGIRWDHNALKNHYRGWNGSVASHDYNWHDSIHSGGGSCGANTLAPCDDNGHGTHTVGTAVGDDGGTNQIGVAPGAKFIGCRNMDQGNGTPARYIECMEFFLAPYPLAGTPAQGNPALAPDITTNSWGCPASEGCSANSLQAAVEAQRAAGIMMVVAAGNSGSACSTVSDPPSFYDASYTVGALVNSSDTIASFSSRGPITADGSLRLKPDIAAPGTAVRSATRSSVTAYTSLQGTSMATPHVAGAIAVLWSAQPYLRNDISRTEDLFNTTATHVLSNTCDSGQPLASPNNTYGFGRIDVKAAVDKLELLSAVSRQTHGAAGTFDIPLPLTGEPGLECRQASSYTVVLNFNNPIASGNVSVSSGTATAGTPVIAGKTMSVTLSGVTDVQKVTVALNNITSTAAQTLPASSVSMNVLMGDVNASKSVSSSDVGQAKAAATGTVDATNFRADVIMSGTVNSSDIGFVKSRVGFSVP